jgi:hypothetical protein
VGQALDQLGGLYARAVRAVEAAQRSGDAYAVVHLVAAQLDEVVWAGTPSAFEAQTGAKPAQLGRITRNVQKSVLDDVGVDSLGRRDSDDFVHRGTHGAHQIDDAGTAVRGGVGVARPRQFGRQPTAVAARGAEAGKLTFQQHNSEVGLRLL